MVPREPLWQDNPNYFKDSLAMPQAIPSYEQMMPVVLQSLVDGQPLLLREVYERVCAHYTFSPEQLAETLPSGRQSTIRSRVGWAKTYLVKAGLIDGARLAALMIEYGVGVTTRQTLTIKALDSDYFLEE